VLGELAPDVQAARERVATMLDDGTALERVARMVAALGGPADLVERPGQYLVAAPVQRPVPAQRDG